MDHDAVWAEDGRVREDPGQKHEDPSVGQARLGGVQVVHSTRQQVTLHTAASRQADLRIEPDCLKRTFIKKVFHSLWNKKRKYGPTDQ